MMGHSTKSVAVIGAGAAGLVATEVFSCSGLKVKAFEKSKECGGVWNYATNKKNGPMYKTLRSNLPREIMAFPGFPFIDEIAHVKKLRRKWQAFKSSNLESGDDHTCTDEISAMLDAFSSSQSSFVNHLEVQLYLERYAMEHELSQFVQFGANVYLVEKSGEQWDITYSSSDGTLKTETFDNVVVANGHYNEPYLPHLEGIEKFTGEVMHSLDYDGPIQELYGDRAVLIVGGRSSGTDLAREISAVASRVYCSDRNLQRNPGLTHGEENDDYNNGPEGGGDRGFGTFENLYYRPGLVRVSPDGHGVVFTDGTEAKVDVIVWCTGYLYDFPFFRPSVMDASKLPEDIDKSSRDNLFANRRNKEQWAFLTDSDNGGTSLMECNGRRLKGLYEQCFCARDPTLSFIGIPYSIVPFPLFYVQARWIAAVISGANSLPPPQEMEKWLNTHQATISAAGQDNDSKYHYAGAEQWNYNRRIARRGNVGAYSRSGPKTLKRLLRTLNTSEKIYNDNNDRRPRAIGLDDDYRRFRYDVYEDEDEDDRGLEYYPYETVLVGKGE